MSMRPVERRGPTELEALVRRGLGKVFMDYDEALLRMLGPPRPPGRRMTPAEIGQARRDDNSGLRKVGAAGRAVVAGTLMNQDDEFYGLIAGLGALAPGGETFGEAKDRVTDEQRAIAQADAEQFPLVVAGSELVGGLLGGGAIGAGVRIGRGAWRGYNALQAAKVATTATRRLEAAAANYKSAQRLKNLNQGNVTKYTNTPPRNPKTLPNAQARAVETTEQASIANLERDLAEYAANMRGRRALDLEVLAKTNPALPSTIAGGMVGGGVLALGSAVGDETGSLTDRLGATWHDPSPVILGVGMGALGKPLSKGLDEFLPGSVGSRWRKVAEPATTDSLGAGLTYLKERSEPPRSSYPVWSEQQAAELAELQRRIAELTAPPSTQRSFTQMSPIPNPEEKPKAAPRKPKADSRTPKSNPGKTSDGSREMEQLPLHLRPLALDVEIWGRSQ